jgi:mannitol/fructose-specific phosphotransferase system IIA component (Ntr-type)
MEEKNTNKKKNYIFEQLSYLFLNIFIYGAFFIFNISRFNDFETNYLYFLIGGFFTIIFSLALIENTILLAGENSDIIYNIKTMGPFLGNFYGTIRLFFIIIRFILIYKIFINILMLFFNIDLNNIVFQIIFLIFLFIILVLYVLNKNKKLLSSISRAIINILLSIFLVFVIYFLFFLILKKNIINKNIKIFELNLNNMGFYIGVVFISFSPLLDFYVNKKYDLKTKKIIFTNILLLLLIITNLLTLFIYFFDKISNKSVLMDYIINYLSFLFIVYILIDNFFLGIRAVESLINFNIIPKFDKFSKNKKFDFNNIFYFLIFIVLWFFLINNDFLILLRSNLIIILLIFLINNLSSLILKENFNKSKDLFIAPFSLTLFLDIISIIFICLIIVFIFDIVVLPIVLAIIFISILLFLFYGNYKITNISALKIIINKALNKEINSKDFDTEIGELLFSNERFKRDRFDEIVSKARFIDLEKELRLGDREINLEDFFLFISDEISKKINVNKNIIFNLFIERERSSSCAINDTVAIPHIVIEGEHIFDIIFIRSKKGVEFTNKKKAKAIFVLIGTKDERNFHLQALASIAQLVMDENFEDHWEKCENEEDLRKFILNFERRKFLQ